MKKMLTILLTAILLVGCNNTKKTEGEAHAAMIEASQNGSLKHDQKTPHILIVNYNLENMSIEQHNELGSNFAPNYKAEKI